jgi:hypothetical protein
MDKTFVPPGRIREKPFQEYKKAMAWEEQKEQ